MVPLAEILRPQSLDEYIGQQHLIGSGAVLRTLIESGNIPSMIFWGPPGIGKTTLAMIISNTLHRPFHTLSAISSGVKEVREVINAAQEEEGAILFIDDIHRFNKAQQDSLLGAVERGTITHKEFQRGNKEPASAGRSSWCWWAHQVKISDGEIGVGV